MEKIKIGQRVTCNWGSNKGKDFTVEAILNEKETYSCKMVGNKSENYSEYKASMLTEQKD